MSEQGFVKFNVDVVKTNYDEKVLRRSIHRTLDVKQECASFEWDKCKGNGDSFYRVAATAYEKHLPLVIKPEHIWITLAHGFGQHVLKNAEELRHLFVDHSGQQLIRVMSGLAPNTTTSKDWETHILPVFEKELRANLKSPELVNAFGTPFSTSTPVEVAASQICLMSSMQKYFM